MTNPTVLDVGNCEPDHAAISRMLGDNFKARVLQAHGLDDTLRTLESEDVQLILINRKLDQDYSDGVEILKVLQDHTDFASTPVMLVTNYDEHQQAAVSLGATYGFGKLSLDTPDTRQRISAVLG